MKSFLLIGDKTHKYLDDFAKRHEVAKFDIHIFEPIEHSFGIKDVREMQKAAFMKPLQSKEKILFLSKAELLTIEAQNALLKLLEEPPRSTYIFLEAPTDANFLPTITSRCKIILLQEEKKEISEKRKEELREQRQIIERGSVSQKFTLAEHLSQDKETLNTWLDEMIMELREKILKEPTNTHILILIRQIQKARTIFQTTNVSPRMILEHYFLSQ